MEKLKLRSVSDADLCTVLQSLDIPLDIPRFLELAKQVETPEELAEALTQNWNAPHSDQIYGYVFELWRRFVPDKRSLSIFCSDLDLKMQSDSSDMADDLVLLLKILQTSVDESAKPLEAFDALQLYFETDLESYLYDFILREIESSHARYAKELIEEFIPYLKDPLWFDYLHARALCVIESDEGFLELEKVVMVCCKKADLDLNLEILEYLAKNGHSLFVALATRTEGLIEEQEDMDDFLKIVAAHFDAIEHKQKVVTIEKMIEKNQKLGPTQISLEAILTQKNLALDDL